MCTFPETKPARRSRLTRLRSALRARLGETRGEDGFLLVEVMVSAMLVAMIVVATFNGLDVATRLSADQRRHDQAAILAAQSQEQLRSEPASALNALVGTPHSFTKEVGKTKYTITQEAKNIGRRRQNNRLQRRPKQPPTRAPTSRSPRGWAGPSRPKPNVPKSKRPAS